MNLSLAKQSTLLAVLTAAVLSNSPAHAQTVVSTTTFATGTGVNSTNPDSICSDGNSIWVSYTNTSTGTGTGNSTVVEYDLTGTVKNMYTIPGSVDGLQADTKGRIVALQNQDGNSTVTLINPKTGIVPGSPFTYAVTSATQGYDDIAFLTAGAFVSRTNPASPKDPIIQLLDQVKSPIAVDNILLEGATGTNLATGTKNQPLPDSDPDSLKASPAGGLVLSSGSDGAIIFVNKPGTSSQSVGFLQLLDQKGAKVSSLDDVAFATNATGTFYVSDTNANQVVAIKMSGLTVNSLFASIGSLNSFVSVDTKTGKVKPIVTTFKGPRGILFLK